MDKLANAKIELHCEGARVPEDIKETLPPTCQGDYPSTDGLQSKIESEEHAEWVTVYENPDSEFVLTADENGELAYVRGDESYPAYVYPNQEFNELTVAEDGSDQEIHLGWQHTDRVRVSPVGGCADVCTFCNIYPDKYRLKPAEWISRTIEQAASWEPNPARHCLISGGTPHPDDYAEFDELLAQVAAESSIPVEIMVGAREDPSFLTELAKRASFDGIRVNLEFFDNDDDPRWRRLIPTKQKLGLDTRLKNLEAAREAFPDIEVGSLLLVGRDLAPPEYALKGVEALAERGVTPILSPFRPGSDTPLRNRARPTSAELKDIYDRAQEIAGDYEIALGPECGPCQHNTLSTSDDPRTTEG